MSTGRHSPRFAFVLASVVLTACGGAGGAGASAPSASSPIRDGSCPHDAFCFNVFTGAPGPLGPGRVMLLWTPPEQKGDRDRDVVDLGGLTGQERSFVVWRKDIPPPKRVGGYGVTWGYVFVVPPGVDPRAGSLKSAMGVAQMMFTDAKPVATQLPFASVYPNGLAPGIAGYRTAPVGGSTHDKFFLAPPGAAFDLVVCPTTQPTCRLPAPNPD